MNIYDFKVKDSRGNSVSMGDYEGKVLIDRGGNVAARYSPAYLPENLAEDIEALL